MKIKFEKPTYNECEIGTSNASFYAYCFIDNERYGTVWKFKDDGRYVLNEDYNRLKHDKQNRPNQIVAPTLNELRERIKSM